MSSEREEADDPRLLWLTHLPRDLLGHLLRTHVPSEDHACVARACRELREALVQGEEAKGAKGVQEVQKEHATPRFRTRVFASSQRCAWAHAQGWRPGPEASFRGAAETTDLELLEYVWQTHLTPGVHARWKFLAQAYRYACTHGNIATMEWLEQCMGLSVQRIAQECILCAATGGHVEMAEWIFQRVPWLTAHHLDDALTTCIRHGHLRMMQWLLERPVGAPHLHLAARQAAFYAQRELMHWLVDRHPLWALLRDPDHTSFHVSATFIRVYLLRSRNVELVRCAVEWGIFATLDNEYLHICIHDFFDLVPTYELPDLHDLHEWIDVTFPAER